MVPFFGSTFANPSSSHVMGREAARAVESARQAVACFIGVTAEDLIFTSGATESNNIVFSGLAGRLQKKHRIVVSAGEHKSVLEPCKWLSDKGFDVVQIPLNRSGIADITIAEELINNDTVIVSIQGANNETGVIQPIRAIAEIARSRGALIHCDIAQLPGKVLHLSLEDVGIDFASISAHKFYGPKGIGALFVRGSRAKAVISPLFRGGGQESEFRPGTLNVPAIVGFGKASQINPSCLEEEIERIQRLRDLFEREMLSRVSDVFVIGEKASRLPGTSTLCFIGVPGDALVARATNICISTGSACTSGTVSPSHVILACGYSRDMARCVVRVSLGRHTTQEEIAHAVEYLAACVKAIRDNCAYQPS